MLKAKKQLLGISGLVVAVAALAAVVVNIPAKAESAQSEVQVQVVVYSASPDLRFTKPVDGKKTTNPKVAVSAIHSKSKKISYKVTKAGALVDTINYTPAEMDGIHDFNVNVAAHKYGEYVINGLSTAENGVEAEDFVSFEYVPVIIKENGTDPETGNPIVKIEYGPDVEQVCLNITSQDGNHSIKHCVDTNADGEPGSIDTTLPFDEEGFPSGKYDIEETPFEKDDDGNLVEIEDYTPTGLVIEYKQPKGPEVPSTDGDDTEKVPADAPETPNTGSFFTKFGLAKSDMLITSVICFMIVTALALIILNKKKAKK